MDDILNEFELKISETIKYIGETYSHDKDRMYWTQCGLYDSIEIIREIIINKKKKEI
jgi:hypothetical protein